MIAGQATKLARSAHDIRYDALHDEIVTATPVAQAILVYRGAANGEEAPIRMIQGPHTQLWDPDHVDVDPVHNELFVPDNDKVLVFPRDAKGDVAPIRTIMGPRTKLSQARAIAVDPVHDLIIVADDNPGGSARAREAYEGALLIFRRTDNGDVSPQRVIGGPKAPLSSNNQIQVYPPKGWILVVPQNRGTGGDDLAPGYRVAIWNINDTGDVPPRWTVKGPASTPQGVVLVPNTKEMVVAGGNSVFTYHVPEIF